MRGDEFERSISQGELALDRLKANRTAAYPQNYELWYTYAAGFNSALNSKVDEAVERDGRLDQQTTAELYNQFLSPVRLHDRVGEVSSSVSMRINEILELLEGSEESVGSYGDALRAASDGLGNAKTQAQSRAIVERILAATREIESKNTELEQQLHESREQIEGLHDSLEAIRFESLTDQLTGIANRKHFDRRLHEAVEIANAEARRLCLAFCDIDHFKKFNDTWGHPTGDQVLRLVGATLKGMANAHDLPARFGGEEFAIIIFDQDIERAAEWADRVRTAVMEKELVRKSTGDSLGRVTMSAGVTSYVPGETVESFLERADQLLYDAKRTGRNRVVSVASAKTPAKVA